MQIVAGIAEPRSQVRASSPRPGRIATALLANGSALARAHHSKYLLVDGKVTRASHNFNQLRAGAAIDENPR
ncbi:hypothetical protein [Nonomuraea dietziae]|uniref:hypothetical protein n=1 Tax=Nonomuraea dietziae TaxID=65515 RepID=UPI0031E3F7BA